MGFPVAFSDSLPKLVLYMLMVLGFVQKFVCALLSFLRLGNFLEPETAPDYSSAALIRELLPVVKFADLEQDLDAPASESCAVCLYEFGGEDQIRRLRNCRHIFHRSCVDRWMDHHQETCPLCRMPFIQEAFDERIWLASGISHLYSDYSLITPGL
ncbi:brassinosteroid-responsive RING protein 1-like [Salvia hispanica]|uniref:brassinosteroid-responsive RING protein 1-like n=1 Tax=Salvia hispanica TaxID=49212 RepID=UPI0020097149|nr:brassinosteroid-responsive RING protein 1-like [Salvia hispanica]